jgi:hypothetical protein
LPKDAEDHEFYRNVSSGHSGSKEGYKHDEYEDQGCPMSESTTSNCNDWKNAFYAMILLMIIGIICHAVIHLKSKCKG